MKSKQPKSLDIKSLLGTDNYVIPIYQRNYEWRESQITQMIQDIVDYAIKNKVSEDKSKYYIGTLVVYERKQDNGVIYETIDGQQRLTTLTLLLNVIRKEYPELDLSWYKKLNLLFDSRKLASDTLSYIFNKESLDNKECNVAIKQGYCDIKKSLSKILIDNSLSIEEFFNYFCEQVIILRVSVPEDTDLNHYFEIMNSRGEQLEKHEVLKAKMLEVLDDNNLKYAFNLIWEATSNMEKYVQYGFTITQRDELFGKNNWNDLVSEEEVYTKLTPSEGNKIEGEELTIDQLLKTSTLTNNSNPTDENPERFNSIINFSNFLLHILRIQIGGDIPLDDKRLLELFDSYLQEDNKKEFVKNFGYNLLKGKFYFDKFILKRECVDGSDHWSLKRLKCYDSNKASYVNTFDDGKEELNNGVNKEILMLLSMFHVSSPTLVYKHWLNASLKFTLQYSGSNLANDYKIYLENLAKAFLNDRYLAKKPKDFFEIIYINKGERKNSKDNIDLGKLNQGTSVENFIFNYLDYLLWKDYMKDKNFFNIEKGQEIEDNRIKDFEYTFRSSVEHYYPQHPIDKSLTLKEEDAIWLDNFGNLCLISSSKNSRLSNLSPEAKKDYYKSSLTIDSIKQRIMMEYNNWYTIENNKIKEHNEKMVELLSL